MADVGRLPAPTTETWNWQLNGACRDMDSSLFFHPDRERGGPRSRRDSRAKQVCRGCAVVEQCRTHALAVQEPYGVWGGLTPAERNEILRLEAAVERS